MVAFRAALPLLIVASLIVFEERISIPSCEIMTVDRPGDLNQNQFSDDPSDLKVMMVADLLLTGSDASFTNLYFRDSYTTKFFRKSFERLKPDMLVVLGDVSAKGFELTYNKWLSVLRQFQRMLGPFLGLPLHIILGDRDIGECCKINANSVDQMASTLPGLDSAGCGGFEVSNVSFVSLNAVAMLCGNNDLRLGVERVIERESTDLQSHAKKTKKVHYQSNEQKDRFTNFRWRENAVSSGSGPVLLLHFPLHHTLSRNCGATVVPKRNTGYNHKESSMSSQNSGVLRSGPYESSHTIPANATEYIFQALRPRIIFSAHTHQFCDHIHIDGTREVTVPAMTWDAKDDPSFVIATFRQNKSVTVSRCSLARESHVLMAYATVVFLLIWTILMRSRSHLIIWAGNLVP